MEINGIKSDILPLVFGVPQGLNVLFINDIPYVCSNTDNMLYRDHAVILSSNKVLPALKAQSNLGNTWH